MSNISTVYASTVAALDSDVRTGGGTDDTAALQAVLDRAKTEGGIRLIMDGAALISQLVVYSNTTIECLNQDCGFFQKEQSNRAIITNAHWDRHGIQDRNITLKGGTYNQDCLRQMHDVPYDFGTLSFVNPEDFAGNHWVFAIEFYGVENVLLQDLLILDFRTFCVTIGNFRRVTLERVWVDLPNRMHAQNQDGFHFWGPGQFLTIRDCGGKVGDDFMNIGPDEGDRVSSITDVLVDGIFLDDADQAIRILSRGSGLIDRCTIRNVQGSYRSFGFYINSWFPDVTAGNFGDIFIENVNLTHTEPNYPYRPPMLFSVGGDIRCLTLKNIRHEYPIDKRAIGEFGFPFYATSPATIDTYEFPAGKPPVIKNLIIDGLTTLENADSENMEQLQIFGEIGNLILRNVVSVKDDGVTRSGNILKVYPTGHVKTAIVSNVFSVGAAKVIDGEERIDQLVTSEVIAQ
ncbi:MAG: hypothetical protein IJW40_00430 [Clostridia bacterium]|nr:hypothetical protein [Clostridia bacterium]